MQKKLNLHYTLSLDLFGSEVSTNAANAFNAGLKGRFQETKIEDDHKLEQLDLSGAQARRRRDQARRRAGADRRQHAAARRLHRRLPARPRPLEQDHRAHRRQRSSSSCRTSRFHRQIGEFRDVEASPDRPAARRGRVAQGQGQVAAVEG